MTVVPLLAQSAFEPEVIDILAAAFEDAWASIEKSGSSLASPRYKRVAPLTARINRIERRYEVVSTAGEVLQAVETSEDIRIFSPEELTEALLRSGFSQQQAWWDYGQASRDTDPQFFTVAARPTPAA